MKNESVIYWRKDFENMPWERADWANSDVYETPPLLFNVKNPFRIEMREDTAIKRLSAVDLKTWNISLPFGATHWAEIPKMEGL